MSDPAQAVGGGAPSVRMPLRDHIAELRNRLFVCALAVAVCSVAAFALWDHVLHFLVGYYRDATRDQGTEFVNLSPLDGITVRLRVSGYLGLFAASPVWLWQVWRFVTPALKKSEKRYAIPFLLSSVSLFLFGAAMGLLTLPAGLQFLVSYAGRDVKALYSVDKFVNLVVLIVVAFGFSFLFPVFIVFLELVRLVTWRQLLRGWRYAIVIIFVIAAVITPSQDPYTLIAMAGPMVLFYFGSIGLGWVLRR